MTIQRNDLLQSLIAAKHNGFVKVLTGIRRCGKSYLLSDTVDVFLKGGHDHE